MLVGPTLLNAESKTDQAWLYRLNNAIIFVNTIYLYCITLCFAQSQEWCIRECFLHIPQSQDPWQRSDQCGMDRTLEENRDASNPTAFYWAQPPYLLLGPTTIPSTGPNHHTWLVHCKKGATLGGVSVNLCTHRRPGWRECSETQPRTHAPGRRDTKQNVTSLHTSATAYRPDNPSMQILLSYSAGKYHSILCANTTPYCVLIPLHSVC
jgi:hypothetical protein